MLEVVLEGPLAALLKGGTCNLEVDGRPCAISEAPLCDMLNLRGNASNIQFTQAVLDVSGLRVPVIPNTASLSDKRQLLWLGPDEWLLKLHNANPQGAGDATESALRNALLGQHVSIVQVGSGNTTLRVQGPAAADLLARGCPLDLHPRAFPTGSLAQTHIAKASATILCIETATNFEVTVRRSFADYLCRWLQQAGA